MPSFMETKVRGVEDLDMGDQIAVDRGDIKHHMIVTETPIDLKKVHVIHYYNDTLPGAKGVSKCCGKSGFPIAEVRRDLEDISSDVRKGRVYRIDYSTYTSRYVTVKRAESKLGKGEFCPFTNNCEHLATWCKTGVHKSSQSEAFWEERKVHGGKHGAIATAKVVANVANVGAQVALVADNFAKQIAHMEWAKALLENVGHDGSIRMVDPFMTFQTKSPSALMQTLVTNPSAMIRQTLDRQLEMGRRAVLNELSYTAAGGRLSIKGSLEAAAKSEGTSFSKKIMENQAKIGIGITAAVEGYNFLSRSWESVKKCEKGEISTGEFAGEVATHAVKGVVSGAATYAGGTLGQTVGSTVGLAVGGLLLGPLAPVVGAVGGAVGGVVGAMAGKAAVMLGGWLLGSLF